MYRMGLGDVLNPTAGTALDCGLLAGGVFKGACWCASFPTLCPSSDYVATQTLMNPDLYAPIQAPPPVAAPADPAILAGALPADPNAVISGVIAQQKAAQDAQNMATMDQTAFNLDTAAANQPSLFGGTCTRTILSGICNSWIYLGGAALGLFAMVSFSGGGSPRRYGR